MPPAGPSDPLSWVGDERDQLPCERSPDFGGADRAQEVSHRDWIASRISGALAPYRGRGSLATGVRSLEERVGGEDPCGRCHHDPFGAEEMLTLVRRHVGWHVIGTRELLYQDVDVVR